MADGTAERGDGIGSRRTLAEKLDRLFRAGLKGRRPPSHEEVATAINIAVGEKTISGTYVWQLRTGRKTNPTKRHLEALASYFGVSPAYFLDGEEGDRVEEQMELLDALKQADVRSLALRAHELSASSRRSIMDLVGELRRMEGLEDDPATPPPPAPGAPGEPSHEGRGGGRDPRSASG
ncbi:XRE family transcriptional regulator [Streptomyces sp. NPDC006678]|uniref:XRE family transcriptional regulator n=1 Tax=Streptomyces sp. NPDC006678 TaxID=3157185 RepID=UPI0033D5E6E6